MDGVALVCLGLESDSLKFCFRFRSLICLNHHCFLGECHQVKPKDNDTASLVTLISTTSSKLSETFSIKLSSKLKESEQSKVKHPENKLLARTLGLLLVGICE